MLLSIRKRTLVVSGSKDKDVFFLFYNTFYKQVSTCIKYARCVYFECYLQM